MQEAVGTVSGRGVADLPNVLRNAITGIVEIRRDGAVCTLVVESMSLATVSELMVVIIVSRISEETYKIRMIAGGGRQGLLGLAWGSEGRKLRRLIKTLEDVCQRSSWELSME